MKTRLTASLTVEIAPRYLTTIMTAAELFEPVAKGGASDFSLLMKGLNQNKPLRLIDGLAMNRCVEPVSTIDAEIGLRAIDDSKFRINSTTSGLKFEYSINAQRGSSKLHIQFTPDVRYQIPGRQRGPRSSGSTGAGSELGQSNSWEDLGPERAKVTGQQTKER